MKPAPFEYVAAESLAHALEIKAKHGDEARFLAGGQSLIPAMNFRLARPSCIVDINPLVELDYVRKQGNGALQIGALTRHRTVERHALIVAHQPLLHEAAPNVAHPQIRNRGTLCGNLANADPASEFPAVIVALGARLRAQSSRGERWIEARDFFMGLFTTAMRTDEMLVEVEIPKQSLRTGTCFIEVARRRGDYAMMGVACVVTLREDGVCSHAQLVYCNAGESPVGAMEAAGGLIGRRISEKSMDEAAALVPQEIRPSGNVHASAAFKRHLAGVLTRRALGKALARAQSQCT